METMILLASLPLTGEASLAVTTGLEAAAGHN